MKKNVMVILIMMFLLPACSFLGIGGAPRPFTVSGKVARGKTTVSGVDVYAYKASNLLDFSDPDFRAKTDDTGNYAIRFKKTGEYYIVARTFNARGREAGQYAFYGRNPVYVTRTGAINVNLNLQKIKRTMSFTKSDTPGIKCILTKNGEPLRGATVYVAVDLNEGMQTKGLVQSGLSDANGEVFIPIDIGTYYLTARKRVKTMFGPMTEGDLIGFYHKNPMVVSDTGTYTIGIELIEIPAKSAGASENPLQTVITGTVRDESGGAVDGIWVGAYNDPQMFGKPLFISMKSGADGKFILRLPKGGKYYLAGRNTLGGPPATGDLYGQYSGIDDHSITIDTGTRITGIEIIVKEMW